MTTKTEFKNKTMRVIIIFIITCAVLVVVPTLLAVFSMYEVDYYGIAITVGTTVAALLFMLIAAMVGSALHDQSEFNREEWEKNNPETVKRQQEDISQRLRDNWTKKRK